MLIRSFLFTFAGGRGAGGTGYIGSTTVIGAIYKSFSVVLGAIYKEEGNIERVIMYDIIRTPIVVVFDKVLYIALLYY